MQKKKVRMYSLSTCVHCRATKRFLDQCTVQYDVTDVDLLDTVARQAVLADVRKWNPRCSFPTILIGDTVIVGFQEDEIKKALELP